MTGHARWAVLVAARESIRGRLADGWEPWETTEGTQWARLVDERVEREPLSDAEAEVLDVVMREEIDGE